MATLAYEICPSRHPGESFKAFRKRRKAANADIKGYLRGVMVQPMPRKKQHPAPLPLVTAGRPKSLRVPLHLSPWDDRLETRKARAEFAANMAALNPNGFRQPGKNGTSLVEQYYRAAR